MSITFELLTDDSVHGVDAAGKVTRTHQRTYLAKSNSAGFVSSYEVAVATGFSPGDTHPQDTAATVRKIAPKRHKTIPPHQKWDVSIEWSTETPTIDEEAENPLNRRVVRSESTSDQSRYINRDKHGKLILTSSKTPFDGGIPINMKLGSINFTRNEDHGSGYYVGKATILSGRVNSLPFLGADPGTLMLHVTADETYEGDYHFWAVNYSFVHDPLGWQPRPINASLFELVDGEPVRIQVDGADATDPVPLDAAGSVIPVANRPDDCIFVEVDYYETMDFNSLGLPTS